MGETSDAAIRRSASARHISGHAATAGKTALPQSKTLTRRTGNRAGRRSRVRSTSQSTLSGRPLLVIDGDSFAHRSYHALPKTIRRSDGKSAGAILGFANFLLRLYADERPRAVTVGWDTLGGANEAPRNVSRLSKRTRVRRGSHRAVERTAQICFR